MKEGQIDNLFYSRTTDIILESITDGVFTVDQAFTIMSFNKAAESITGFTRQEAIGRPCWEIFRSSMCKKNCVLSRTLHDKKSHVNLSAVILHKSGEKISVSISAALLKNEVGEIIGGVETFRDLSAIEELKKALHHRFQFGDIISKSPAMQEILKVAPKVASSGSTVLIEGETGTGKELLARAIHNCSPRKKNAFIAINCGALPDSLLESELFGYKAGAFTHAVKDKPGYFDLANNGTILLDEIGDTSPAFQVKLLRVLEEKEFTPLGGLKPTLTNASIIAATNKSLSQLVEQELFRQDLYYRVNVIHMELPPLRERKEDIPLLIDRFVARRNKLDNRSITGVDNEVLQCLMDYHYPGNIRELENIIERAFILCRDDTIHLEHLARRVQPQVPNLVAGNLNCTECINNEVTLIEEALKRNNYNRIETAKDLGIHKSTLFRKLQKLGLSPPKSKHRKSRK